MRECQEKLPSFLFTTNIIPPDRVQIFDAFLFSGGAFRSSAGCLRPKVSLLVVVFSFLPSFYTFSDEFRVRLQQKGTFPAVSQHVLCIKLQSAGARVVSKRYLNASKQGKERALKLGARHSWSRSSVARGRRKEQGVLGGNQNLVLTDPVECFYCVRARVYLSVCVCVCCYSADFLRLLVLVYAADFAGIVKSARSRFTPLANRILSSRRLYTPLSSTALLLARYYRPDTLRQVCDVLVAALGAQLLQRLVQGQQVVPVQPARPL